MRYGTLFCWDACYLKVIKWQEGHSISSNQLFENKLLSLSDVRKIHITMRHIQSNCGRIVSKELDQTFCIKVQPHEMDFKWNQLLTFYQRSQWGWSWIWEVHWLKNIIYWSIFNCTILYFFSEHVGRRKAPLNQN